MGSMIEIFKAAVRNRDKTVVIPSPLSLALPIIQDGNTVGWWDATDLTTITKDGSNKVSLWKDKLNSGNGLSSDADPGSFSPLWSSSGILFDGVWNRLKKAFTLIQPEFVYIVLRIVSPTDYGRIWNGIASNSGDMIQSIASKSISQNAGSNGSYVFTTPSNEFIIIRSLYSGVDSFIKINNGISSLPANCGSSNMGGFTLGANGDYDNASNIQVKEVILRKSSDPVELQNIITNYLNDKYSVSPKDKILYNTICEGHSFITSVTYMSFLISNTNRVKSSFDVAVSGSTISQVIARQVTIDTHLVTETPTYKNILVLYIGVNNVVNTAGQGLTAYNSLKSYVQARATAGWKVFVYTMTPSTAGGRGATFETERGIFNNLLRTDLSLIAGVYILDTDTIPEYSYPSTSHLTYYGDNPPLHPSLLGAPLLAQLFTNKMVELYG